MQRVQYTSCASNNTNCAEYHSFKLEQFTFKTLLNISAFSVCTRKGLKFAKQPCSCNPWKFSKGFIRETPPKLTILSSVTRSDLQPKHRTSTVLFLSRPWNDQLCVERDVKHYSLIHSLGQLLDQSEKHLPASDGSTRCTETPTSNPLTTGQWTCDISYGHWDCR